MTVLGNLVGGYRRMFEQCDDCVLGNLVGGHRRMFDTFGEEELKIKFAFLVLLCGLVSSEFWGVFFL